MFHINLSSPVSNPPINTNLEEYKSISISHDGGGFEDVILEGAKSYVLTIVPESDGL
ncbi:MAG TPA: hypothetical protein VIY47_15390 [Ignavibacteriaceae bacterium]